MFIMEGIAGTDQVLPVIIYGKTDCPATPPHHWLWRLNQMKQMISNQERVRRLTMIGYDRDHDILPLKAMGKIHSLRSNPYIFESCP